MMMNAPARFTKLIVVLSFLLSGLGYSQSKTTDLESLFKAPPTNTKPYVWWHWMGPNFSKAGITKDLEAMKAMGIGGATIFNITSAVQETHHPILNNPWPEQTYQSPAYWEAIKHAANEAKRLGLEIGLHNTAGYSTTGGPWVTEEKGMQRLVYSQVEKKGGSKITIQLKQPDGPIFTGWGSTKQQAVFYKDVAVIAVPIADQAIAAPLTPVNQKDAPATGEAPADPVNRKDVIDLTANMDAQGNLQWNAPAGNWMIYRIGHAPTMANPHPLPDDIIGKSLEVDKMSAELNKFHWNKILNPLRENLGDHLGQSFKHLLIDSYEADFQNWTPGFREEFKRRKGYDPIPWVLTYEKNKDGKAYVVNSNDQTKRFMFDFADVVNQLFFENGWGVGKEMINEAGLQLQFEPYWGPFDIFQGGAMADVPMGEFWTGKNGMIDFVPAAGRTAGKKIIGAEAFTGAPKMSQYTEDPEFLKPTATWAFSKGINRLILHTWVHQPFDDNFQPGMSMGWWGTHFGRHQTWAEPGKAFFQYLGRTQAMLQYGEQPANYLCLEVPDAASSDIISIADFLNNNIKVSGGKIFLPSGRSYPFMLLPKSDKMLPEVLARIKTLVAEGASIVGDKPTQSPSLKNYPACDQEIVKMASTLWGKGTITKSGKGTVFTNLNEALKTFAITQDMIVESADSAHLVSGIHRKGDQGDVYFVANQHTRPQWVTVSFKATGMQPEIWNAENGSITLAPIWKEENGRTHVQLKLHDHQSMFVVFRKNLSTTPHLVSLSATDKKSIDVVIPVSGISYISADESVSVVANYSNGEKKNISIGAPGSNAVTGSWTVDFKPKLEKPFSLSFPTLVDFSNHTDNRVKYFAGTALYKNTISLDVVPNEKQYLLDLGTVNDIVSVKVNGQDLGVCWYPPYQIDISPALKSGVNNMEISVTTNWANRLIGDEQEPADFEWGDDRGEYGRAMKSFPDWFVQNKPRPSQGRKTFLLWYYYRNGSELKPAGLVGPVMIRTRELKKI
jgi:hypothetical protein